MLWSILVPTIPERAEMRAPLMTLLYQLARPWPQVEVLMLEDDRGLAYGDKMQALVRASRGEYVSFVDDDDWVAEDYVDAIVAALISRPDAVAFTAQITTDGADPRAVYYSKDNPVATLPDGQGYLRPIQHLQPVRRAIVEAVPYEGGFGADTRWSVAVRDHCLIHTDVEAASVGPLYFYRWRSGDPDGLWPDQS